MKKGVVISLVCIGILILIAALGFFGGEDVEESAAPVEQSPAAAPTPAPAPKPTPTPKPINYQAYNIDYMNDNVKNKLVRQAGAAGKTAFYLPSTGYINVSRGTKYGVAWLVQNVNPKVPEGNEFTFNFHVNTDSLSSCGVSEEVAQGWIERGWTSTGMIAGQWREDYHEWYDAMTVYFAFPADVEPCNIKYDFVITKDGAAYDERVLEFRIL